MKKQKETVIEISFDEKDDYINQFNQQKLSSDLSNYILEECRGKSLSNRITLNMKIKFKIKGLDCANCANQLEREIQKIDGIISASISFMSEIMTIEFDNVSKEELINNLRKIIKKEEPDVIINEI